MSFCCARRNADRRDEYYARRLAWLANSVDSSPTSPEAPWRDSWGFSYPAPLAEEIDEFENLQHSRLRQRRDLDFENRLTIQPDFSLWKSDVLKSACREGLPFERRKQVWLFLLKVNKSKSSQPPGFYSSLLADGQIDAKLARVIQADLRRTFPTCPLFRKEQVLIKLRNVLFAFASSRKDVGYCQGLNFVCGVLLVVLGGIDADEEELFFAFCQLIDSGDENVGLNVRGYFEPRMHLILADLKVVQRLLDRVGAGRLSQRLKQGDLTTLLCSEWLHAFFSTAFPFTVVVRIWDAILFEGWKVIFRVAAATISLVTAPAAEVLSEEELLTHHKRLSRGFVNHELLLNEAFYNLGTLRRSDLTRWRTEAKAQASNASISLTTITTAQVGIADISLEDLNISNQQTPNEEGPVSNNAT